jgi:hypothetical protein
MIHERILQLKTGEFKITPCIVRAVRGILSNVASFVSVLAQQDNSVRMAVLGGIPKWPNGADCKSVAEASKVRILLPPPGQKTPKDAARSEVGA